MQKITKAEKEREKLTVFKTGRTQSDLIHEFLNDDLVNKTIAHTLGIVCLLLMIFLLAWIHFNVDKQVSLPLLSPSLDQDAIFGSSPSAFLRYYKQAGDLGITFNEILKILFLLLIILLLLNKLTKICLTFFSSILLTSLPKGLKVDFLEKYTKKTFILKEWLAAPDQIKFDNRNIYPPSRMKLPQTNASDFKYLKFNATILQSTGHWRVGIFITSEDKTKDYVFHLYSDLNDPSIKSRMTKRDFNKGKHINSSDKTIELNNPDSFLFEVRKVGDNIYALFINKLEVNRYKVPKENFQLIDIGAWADDSVYQVKFTNIEFKG